MPITLIDEIEPKNNGDFPMVKDTYLKGGYRVVANSTARDAITDERKTIGMIAHVVDDGKDYRWNGTTWVEVVYGSGDVTGPASSTDNAIARYNGDTGKLLQNSSATLTDNGSIICTNLSAINNHNNVTSVVISNLDTTDENSIATVIASGYHPVLAMLGGGSNGFGFHLDPNDTFALKETLSISSLSNPLRKMTREGVQTLPLQPRFKAYRDSDVSNVTGDGTVYTVVFNVEEYDIHDEYDITTGVFTAAEDGIYLFNMAIILNGLTLSHDNGNITYLSSSSGSMYHSGNFGAMRNSVNDYAIGLPFIKNMDAGDTMNIRAQVSGGTKVVDVESIDQRTYFSAYLLG